MKQVTINIGDSDLEDLKKIFENEKDFKPVAPQDYLLIALMKQVINNPKIEIPETSV